MKSTYKAQYKYGFWLSSVVGIHKFTCLGFSVFCSTLLCNGNHVCWKVHTHDVNLEVLNKDNTEVIMSTVDLGNVLLRVKFPVQCYQDSQNQTVCGWSWTASMKPSTVSSQNPVHGLVFSCSWQSPSLYSSQQITYRVFSKIFFGKTITVLPNFTKFYKLFVSSMPHLHTRKNHTLVI